MAWIKLAIEVILGVLKALFGMDKPATTEVTNAKPEKPLHRIDDDPDLLRDLGVHSHQSGTADQD